MVAKKTAVQQPGTGRTSGTAVAGGTAASGGEAGKVGGRKNAHDAVKKVTAVNKVVTGEESGRNRGAAAETGKKNSDDKTAVGGKPSRKAAATRGTAARAETEKETAKKASAKETAATKKATAGKTAASGTTAAKTTAAKTTTAKTAASKATAPETAASETAEEKAAVHKKAAAKGTAGEKPAKKASTKKAAAGKTDQTETAAKAMATAGGKKGGARKTAAGDVSTGAADQSTAKKAGAARAAKQTGATTVVAKKTPGTATAEQTAVPKARLAAAEPGELAVRPGEEPWTPEEVEEARAELTAEALRLRAEISSSEASLVGLMRDSGDGAGDDQADTGTKNITREHELALAANAREMLNQTERALERLDAGTYGLCENCGNPIGKARMQAFPRATLCVECKQKQERRS